MKKLIALSLVAACTGCLSICRIPMPSQERFSDEGVCTNRVWTSLRSEYRSKHPDWRGWRTVFPTIQMRYVATKEVYFKEETPEELANMTGEQKYKRKWSKRCAWFPLTILWLTSPLDAVWDIVCMPWDVCED